MRILVLKSKDPILEFLINAWTRHGEEVLSVDGFSMSSLGLKMRLNQFKPDIVFMNNFDVLLRSGGKEIEELLEQRNIPLVTWHFESPEIAGGVFHIYRMKQGLLPKNLIVFVTDSYFVPFFKSKGVPAFHLPLAADESLLAFRAPSAAASSFDGKLLFSGGCLEPLEPLKSYVEDGDYLTLQVERILVEFEKMTSVKLPPETRDFLGRSIHRLLEGTATRLSHYRSEREAFLVETRPHLMHDSLRGAWDIFMGRLDVLASFYQLTVGLRFLATEAPLLVHGSPVWNKMIRGLCESARTLDLDEVYAGFQSAQAVLCVTKQVFHHFIHERVFWTYALRGLPLTDERADLRTAFGPDEILTYSDFREIPEKLKFLESHPDERNRLIAKGHERVRNHHLYRHRATTVVETLKGII